MASFQVVMNIKSPFQPERRKGLKSRMIFETITYAEDNQVNNLGIMRHLGSLAVRAAPEHSYFSLFDCCCGCRI